MRDIRLVNCTFCKFGCAYIRTLALGIEGKAWAHCENAMTGGMDEKDGKIRVNTCILWRCERGHVHVVMLEIAGKAGTKDGYAILDRMAEHGVSPNVITYTSFMDVLCKTGGKLSEGEVLMTRMREQGLSPSNKTYSILLNICVRQGTFEVSGFPLKPGNKTDTNLLNTCVRKGILLIRQDNNS